MKNDGIATIVSASSSSCGEAFISVWVREASRKETASSHGEPQMQTVSSILQTIVNIGVMVIILTFIQSKVFQQCQLRLKIPDTRKLTIDPVSDRSIVVQGPWQQSAPHAVVLESDREGSQQVHLQGTLMVYSRVPTP